MTFSNASSKSAERVTNVPRPWRAMTQPSFLRSRIAFCTVRLDAL